MVPFSDEPVEVPMFDYYGSKQVLAPLYPPPQHDLLIEAFAGSAGYALHGDNWRRDVILMERNRPLADVWQWLIDEATPSRIRALPDLAAGQSLSDIPSLMRAVICHVESAETKATRAMVAMWNTSRATMADNVWKVKHWQVRRAECYEAPEAEATWFIDPPYQGPVGDGYSFGSSSLNFARLAEWIRSRRGQVIACESGCADYLPFVPLRPGADLPQDPHAEFVWYSSTTAPESGIAGAPWPAGIGLSTRDAEHRPTNP
jgi:hypothetical protein